MVRHSICILVSQWNSVWSSQTSEEMDKAYSHITLQYVRLYLSDMNHTHVPHTDVVG